MLNKRVFQNALFIVLIGLFAFPQIINLFSGGKDVITKIGNIDIKYKDLVEFGGRDNSSFQIALAQAMSVAYIQDAFIEIGLAVSDKASENEIKKIFISDDKNFDPDKVLEYLKKTNMSQSGLVKLITDNIRRKQLFFACESFVTPDTFVDMYHRGINRVRSGYYMNIDIASMDERTMMRYANASQQELIELGLQMPNIASKEYYVFYVDKDDEPVNGDLKALMQKYKYQKLMDGAIDGFEFDPNEIDRTTLRSGVKSKDGAKYFIYYNPVDNNFMKNLRYESKFHSFVAKKIAAYIKTAVNKKNVKSFRFGDASFMSAERISFANNFQYKRCAECVKSVKKCDRCRSNDCVSVEHMNPRSGYSREVLIMMLLGKLGEVYFSNANPQIFSVCMPMNEEFDEKVDRATVKKVLDASLRATCQKCSFKDTEQSSASII